MGMQSSLSIFNQKYICKYKDTYFILQNKYLRINEDSFGAKILRRDDCALSTTRWTKCQIEIKECIMSKFTLDSIL